ncbi:MAG: P1 family peptidase [Gammaproteobacteria bacterium]|nr:P1 family peptidase [Gammaproteobacteria bacterium]
MRLTSDRQGQSRSGGLTAVKGIAVGHHTLGERPTGCTVVLTGDGAVAGVDVRGGAPGTVETDLLDPVATVQRVHAIVLTGGSAFGLAARDGVMRYLDERGVGHRVGGLHVPIVAGAVIYDLFVGDRPEVRPGSDCGYRAAATASGAMPAEGNVGAGAGATVGKIRGLGCAMKGGAGTASASLSSGVTVGALAVVNALGDVVDPATGRVVAGVRTPDGRSLADARVLVRESPEPGESEGGANTTIGVVATNAALTPAETTKLAQMAQDGLARAIYPSHTPRDGDTVFSLATGTFGGEASLAVVGALAADVMAEAIVRGVKAAAGVPGYPAVSDLADGRCPDPAGESR